MAMKKPTKPTGTNKKNPAKPVVKPTAKPKQVTKPKTKSKMTPEDKAYNDLMNKYKGDITKIPGFKNGKGTM